MPGVPGWSGATIDTADFVPGPGGVQIHASHAHFASHFMAEAMERSGDGMEPEAGEGLFPDPETLPLPPTSKGGSAEPQFMGVAVGAWCWCAHPAMASAIGW